MKTSITTSLCIALSFLLIQSIFCQSKYPYKDSKLPVEKRIDDLLKRMTTDEKIKQMDMYGGKEVANMAETKAVSFSKEKVETIIGTEGIGSIHDFYPVSASITNEIQKYAIEKTRLGIPVLFIEEGLHGYCGFGSTYFPIPLQLSSAWDTSLVYSAGRVIATEARAHGINMILGPVLCMARDPRWGRVEETYGEDTYLDALNGVAMVRGLQGNSLADNDAVIAEPKHFAVHSIPEGGTNIASVSIGEREARSSFLRIFEKAVRDGGAMGIMAAYHELDGIPTVNNKWLLTDILRKEWGFKGFVLSDLGAIRMTLNSHYTSSDTSESLARTIKAGLNMQFYDFDHEGFQKAIHEALDKKLISAKQLDNAVRDILRVKFMLGLFDKPYTDTTLIPKVFHTEASRNLALKAAQEGIVLLKNKDNVLPINNNIKSIAVIGQLAVSTYMGGYTDNEVKGISILDGLKQRAGNSFTINYEPGYTDDSTKSEEDCRNKAVELAKNSDIAVVVLGEKVEIVGEGKDRSNLDLDDKQLELVRAIYKTGKPVAVVLFNGRPLTINWVAENIPAIVEAWFGGEKGGLAIADVLLGNVNPSGKLPITFPRSLGQLPFYYNHKPTSRHKYVDGPNTPLFAFGHGLSYTTFEYSNLNINPAQILPDGKTKVSVSVKNTGKVKGTEVVQLYIRDEISSVTTPVLSLQGFKRVTLEPGESQVVNFELGFDELALWNEEMKRVVEPGEFTIMAGSSSDDIRLNKSLLVKNK
jgi:beta-glucosidase